jgi:hypothetical protein
MSELARAVEERIASYEPNRLPPFAGLQNRRRRRQIKRVGAIASLVLLLGVAAVIASHPNPGHLDRLGPAPTTPTLAQQFSRLLKAPDNERVWLRDGRPVSSRELRFGPGPAHCSADTSLWLTTQVSSSNLVQAGKLAAGYVRDLKTTIPVDPTLGTFQSPATLPSDATFTGFTLRSAELWAAASDINRYVYVVNGLNRGDIERWPALHGFCN